MVEFFDFFAMEEKETPAAKKTRTNFTGILTAISKIQPDVIKSVISSNIHTQRRSIVPSALAAEHQSIPFPPQIRSDFENKDNVAPLTIFYNGTVTVAHLTSQKAESILKSALDSDQLTAPLASSHQQWSPETFSGARRRSLARFMQKRNERLKSESSLHTSKITDHPQ